MKNVSMRKSYLISSVLLASVLAGCATEQPFEGIPTTFIRTTPNQIASHLSYKCLQGGGHIVEQTQYNFTCAVPMDGSMSSLFIRALVTENNASNPEFNVQSSWTIEGNGVRVTSIAWMEHQNAFGKTTRNPLNHPDRMRELQAGLEKMKAALESANY